VHAYTVLALWIGPKALSVSRWAAEKDGSSGFALAGRTTYNANRSRSSRACRRDTSTTLPSFSVRS